MLLPSGVGHADLGRKTVVKAEGGPSKPRGPGVAAIVPGIRERLCTSGFGGLERLMSHYVLRVPRWAKQLADRRRIQRVSHSRVRYPLRRLTRSSDTVPYPAPHTLSASTDINL
jgi:hypothetical protein